MGKRGRMGTCDMWAKIGRVGGGLFTCETPPFGGTSMPLGYALTAVGQVSMSMRWVREVLLSTFSTRQCDVRTATSPNCTSGAGAKCSSSSVGADASNSGGGAAGGGAAAGSSGSYGTTKDDMRTARRETQRKRADAHTQCSLRKSLRHGLWRGRFKQKMAPREARRRRPN